MNQLWDDRSHFTIIDNILLYNERIVIPKCLRDDVLSRLHDGHLGISKCRAKAKDAVWWPKISKHIANFVSNCAVCLKNRSERKEPLIPTEFPSNAWQKVGSDIFEHASRTYALVVDYYSRWIEIREMKGYTTEHLVNCLKSIFACQGIPETVISDNGPQYNSEEFRKFAQIYSFKHETSSPRFPQANGEAERAVRTVKNLMRKNPDPYMALLAYRTAPLINGKAPCQLLMNRMLQTRIPVIPSKLKPEIANEDNLRKKEESYRMNQKRNFDKRYRTSELPELGINDLVWIRDLKRMGHIIARAEQPRSFIVASGSSRIRRNRLALVLMTKSMSACSSREGDEFSDSFDQGRNSWTLHGEYSSSSSPVRSGEEEKTREDSCAIISRIPDPLQDAASQSNVVSATDDYSPQTNCYVTRSGRPVIPPNRYIFNSD